MSLSLTASSKVFYGFWRSHGVALPRGPVLTLSAFGFTLFTSAATLLVSWAVFRLYRIATAIIFRCIFRQSNSNLDNSMAVVMVVNAQSSWDGITSTLGRFWNGKRTGGFFAFFTISLAAFLLAPALIIWLSFLPSYRQGLLLPNSCGLGPIATDTLLFTALNARRAQWADTALSNVDRNETGHPKYIKAIPPAALPNRFESYVTECPTGVSACTNDFPLTFTSNYTLRSTHFALDTDTPFSLQVSDTCYRPRGASAQLRTTPGMPKRYGLFYSPLRFQTGGGTEYTEALYDAEQFSRGYKLSQYAARKDDFLNGHWTPNSTLLLNGDTTILFYYLGGVGMVKPSSDPLFATIPDLTVTLPNQDPIYYTPIVIPIVCDTQYQFCVDSDHVCSPLAGITSLINWLRDNGQLDLSSFFAAALFAPPIYQASIGSGAVAASHTAPGGVLQLDPDHATAQRELGRLIQAGMAMLASYARLSASGFWDLGLGSQSLSPTASALLCNRIITESEDAISIPLTPYIILLVVIVIIVVVSYADWYLKWDWWQDHSTNWAVHKPGPMLRRVTELTRNIPVKVTPSKEWGTPEASTLGPEVVEVDGMKCFGQLSLIGVEAHAENISTHANNTPVPSSDIEAPNPTTEHSSNEQ